MARVHDQVWVDGDGGSRRADDDGGGHEVDVAHAVAGWAAALVAGKLKRDAASADGERPHTYVQLRTMHHGGCFSVRTTRGGK